MGTQVFLGFRGVWVTFTGPSDAIVVSPSGRDSSLGKSKVGEEGCFAIGVSTSLRRVAASVVPVPPQLIPCKDDEDNEAASPSPCVINS